MPHLVGEVGVGGHDVDFGAHLLEFGVVVGGIFNFGRAVEGEGGRHEDQNGPLAFQVRLGDFDELAVVESSSLERLNLSIDQRHQVAPKWVDIEGLVIDGGKINNYRQ
ncbi:hypothetical protein D9M71_572550 [compost metagenome]